MLTNTKGNGFLDLRLRNLRRANAKNGKSNDTENEHENSEPIDEVNIEDEIQVLKSLIVNEGNMNIIVDKLNLTREYRSTLLKRTDIELKEYFPYFFTHPPLVSQLYQPANPPQK